MKALCTSMALIGATAEMNTAAVLLTSCKHTSIALPQTTTERAKNSRNSSRVVIDVGVGVGGTWGVASEDFRQTIFEISAQFSFLQGGRLSLFQIKLYTIRSYWLYREYSSTQLYTEYLDLEVAPGSLQTTYYTSLQWPVLSLSYFLKNREYRVQVFLDTAFR